MRRLYSVKQLFVIAIGVLVGCIHAKPPEGIEPVRGFDINRYLGKWYEIARLDHPFERNMEEITAEYSLREDGGIKVINSGRLINTSERKEVEGKAYFARSSDEGYLKVSFWGPFYGAYVIFGLDRENYQYAFITSHDRGSLWLLARTPKVGKAIMDHFIVTAKKSGFETEALIFVKHESVMRE